MQLNASMNRSRMLFACTTISGNFSREPPQRSSWVLWTTASMRSTCSPLVNLQSHLAAMQLEDRQIIPGFLDRDFPFGGFTFSLAVLRTALVAQDGPNGLQIQQHAAAVNQCLKHLLHVATDFENQVPAVLHLIIRVLVMKPALLLLFQVERETQAGGINPTLTGPLQPPYHPLPGQGVCDLGQACGVRDMSETIALFGKADSGFA